MQRLSTVHPRLFSLAAAFLTSDLPSPRSFLVSSASQERTRLTFSLSVPAAKSLWVCKKIWKSAVRGELDMGGEGKPTVVIMFPGLQYLIDHDAIESRFTILKLWEADDRMAFFKENADKIKGLVGNASIGASAEVIDALPNLEIVSMHSVGIDKVDLVKCGERGIVVTNTPDVLTDETADFALALVLATMRRVCAADRYVREGLWPLKGDYPLSHKVSGKRFGIVGLGRIGSAIAKRAEGFGCSISYYARSKKSEYAYHFYDSVLELAKNSDILVLSCALTKETTHIVNRDVLNALGPDGTLVNIARGPVVDEPELVKALVEGRLGAAGLDVFEHEPQVPKELLSMDNVVLQPHAASATWETRRVMADLVIRNLEAHFSGKPLLTPVT
ncbi:hypothetical protein O6H91_13G029200 [Diphasiastrum complanatum]|uniref:Uncharacterized protein n=2 Tax=Diphasiastrum complanatum TaxID=34168 RepID=A0ACC2BTD3_DIPCM|nr:hypothetical protein O6H91_13G028700 [Diphasiastrum complanatum]KAJ7533010.1 hypothetical protein O6H91_13G029200 [Diphasiastrum complanatum]